MKLKVIVAHASKFSSSSTQKPFVDEGFIAQVEDTLIASLWSKGSTAEEAIEKFKQEYGMMPFTYDFQIQ
jgi:hypothetical protein